MIPKICVFLTVGLCFVATRTSAQDSTPADPQQLLLLYQSPDGHPQTTHEYLQGQQLLQDRLSRFAELDVQLVNADSPWEEGPELLRQADGVVLFVSEGARWMCEDQRRYQAFAELAARGGAVVVIHWAMGTREAANIEGFLSIAGGCHGGPDRKHAVFETTLQPAWNHHAIAQGVEPTDVREEFYYQLKFVESETDIVPVMTARIEDNLETVAWAWERPDGGRSFGFSGLHFHENWQDESYSRLIVQAVLWTNGVTIPSGGVVFE